MKTLIIIVIIIAAAIAWQEYRVHQVKPPPIAQPAQTAPVAPIAKQPKAQPSPVAAKVANSEVATPPPIPTPTPTPAPVYYLAADFSVTSDSGITGYHRGERVDVLSKAGNVWHCKVRNAEVDIPQDQLTTTTPAPAPTPVVAAANPFAIPTPVAQPTPNWQAIGLKEMKVKRLQAKIVQDQQAIDNLTAQQNSSIGQVVRGGADRILNQQSHQIAAAIHQWEAVLDADRHELSTLQAQ